MTKRIASYLCHIVLLLIIFSTLFLIITIKINADDSHNITPYFDPFDYKSLSADDLQKALGTPDKETSWDYEVSRSEDGVIHYCKLLTYAYGTKEFIYTVENDMPDKLVRIHLQDKIAYTDSNLLALFDLSDNYTNSQTILNTINEYRVFNVGKDGEGIYDFWVTDRDSNYLHDVNITFYNGLFTDDEL